MQPVEPVAVLDLFPEERRHLLELLNGLTAKEWAAPTVCPGWSVKDVAAHLLGGDLSELARGRDGFASPSFAPGCRPGRLVDAGGCVERLERAVGPRAQGTPPGR
jgi:uncharacterized protein (TIGR03083 family)